MKCSRPFQKGMAEFGCGQCMPCLLNRRRLWTSRLMLEAQKHEISCFCTLTFDKEHIPADGSLSRSCAQLFLKRFRYFLYPTIIRYYLVGEYGDRTLRPHYHAAIFGYAPDSLTLDRYGVVQSGPFKDAWPFGNVHVGTLTPQSAGYVVSYVVKRMTRKDDPRLGGRCPEFALMSLRPGIGAPAIVDFKDSLSNMVDLSTGEDYGFPDGDVPSVFRYNGGSFPLGRYLRQRLRVAMGKPKTEPVAVGELRNYRRYVDLSAAGRSGWKVREERRLSDSMKAKKRLQLLSDRKGIGL